MDGRGAGSSLCLMLGSAPLGHSFSAVPSVLVGVGSEGVGKGGSRVLTPDLVVMAKVGASGLGVSLLLIVESIWEYCSRNFLRAILSLLGRVVLLIFISLMGSFAVIADQVALLLKCKKHSWMVMVRPRDRLGTGHILLFDSILLLQ
ncbi:hypothetical protein Tco_1308821 [Tanacetum coccineum]